MSISIMFALLFPVVANADNFYEGKTVKIVVGSSPGGGMATSAQLLAKFMAKHIPGNPVVIVTYKTGASGIKMCNYLNQSNRPNDGTEIGMPISNTLLASLLDNRNVEFDLDSFAFLGSIDSSATGVFVKSDTGVKTIDDAKNISVAMGASSPRSQTAVIPLLMNKLIGTKFRVVSGYSGTGPIYVAMEKNEVSGVAVTYSSMPTTRPQWLDDKYVILLGLLANKILPEYPDVPLITDLIPNSEDRKVLELWNAGTFGRAFFVSKKVPQDRIDILRKAFEDTINDPEFIEFARSRNFPVDLEKWQELHGAIDKIKEIVKTSPDAVNELRDVSGIHRR